MEQIIKSERRFDMLVGAIEGGSNYWYFLDDAACDIIDKVCPQNDDMAFVERLWKALEGGASIPVRDNENEEVLGEISLSTMTERERVMMEKQPRHFADILGEDDDAITADVWFQFVVMNELIYG